jgi:TRAP-type C4-dicarboxylate transport system permease small subunit
MTRVERAAVLALGVVSGAALLSMASVTAWDVVARGIANAPLPAAYEVVQISQAVLVATALPLATRARLHITMGVSLGGLSERLQRLLTVLVDLLSGLFLMVFAWRVGATAWHLRAVGETLMFLGLPAWPMAALLAAGLGVSGLLLLAAVLPRGTR